MVLKIIQWMIVNHNCIQLHYGENQNHVLLRLQPGIPAGQGNSQDHLKGPEGFEGNHSDAPAKANVVL